MKQNNNVTMLKNEEKEIGIIEIQKKLKNAEWRIIGEKKKWIHYCPKCNIEIAYSSKYGLKRSLEEKRLCFNCTINLPEYKNRKSLKLKGIKRSQSFKDKISKSMKGRKITWINKIISKLNGRVVPADQEIKRLESRLKMNYDDYCKRRPRYFNYKSRVMSITKKQPIYLLKNCDKIRGLAGVVGGYQLDHIITIKNGFENNINPHIIGNIRNLKFIPWEENLGKNKNSDVNIQEELKNNCLNEIELKLLKKYSKFDNRLYKIMNIIVEAWYENPNMTKDDGLEIVRNYLQTHPNN